MLAIENAKYAPNAQRTPWAKFGIFNTPNIRVKPTPTKAYNIPNPKPFKI